MSAINRAHENCCHSKVSNELEHAYMHAHTVTVDVVQ